MSKFERTATQNRRPKQRIIILGTTAFAGAVAFGADAHAFDVLSFFFSKPAETVTRMQHVYLGRAPYICTPSGFGRMATCFRRPTSHDEALRVGQRFEER
jgi:hypothetical protein